MKKKIDKNSMAYITNTLWWCWINFWRKKKVLTNYIWYHVKVENTVSMAFSLYIGFSFSSLGMEMEGWKTSNHRSISKLNKIIWHSCHSLQWMFFFFFFVSFMRRSYFFHQEKLMKILDFFGRSSAMIVLSNFSHLQTMGAQCGVRKQVAGLL